MATFLYNMPGFEGLAKAIAKKLKIKRNDYQSNRFANNETQIVISGNVKDSKCFVLGTNAPPDSHIIELMFLCHTLKKEGAKIIFAILPYLAYTRQDREEKQKGLAIDWFAKANIKIIRVFMEVKIIGSRALNPIQDKKIKRYTSAIFIVGKTKLQIDIGNKFSGYINYLLITHLHSDHIGKINTVPVSVKVFVPHKSFQKFIAKHFKLSTQLFPQKKKITIGDFQILAFPVQHSKTTKTFGYLIKHNKKSCVWLPDFRRLAGCLSYFKTLDFLFIGASTFDRPINAHSQNKYGHLDIIDTLKIIKRQNVRPKKIFLIHIGRRLTPLAEKIKILRKMFPEFNLNIAFDNQKILIR